MTYRTTILSNVSVVILLLGLIAIPAVAQKEETPRIEGLCVFIGEKTLNTTHTQGTFWGSVGKPIETRSRYAIEREMLIASGVQQNDSMDVLKLKVQQFWKRSSSARTLTCSNLQFDVTNGNILKYAISSRFDSFIDDVVEWNVDLNTIDPADNRTALDYLDDEIKRTKNLTGETVLGHAEDVRTQQWDLTHMNGWRDDLIEAGAKHRSELP